ncbi:SDR family NAD(P)-dependent oxidoreductase [Bacillus sp. AFS017336]|uniref:SDR family NAD(P)-dependent oxidoreductase n=1 Tax=Bacillus sp. AFS017336 TaxID=2033489 RepID=UPI000BEFBA34|nr:glucose 1-dehydrogenase [Bacillus sp. AFS017336]PEL13248.1 short-chain dehydrogenase [Bacillus sp. AFS017336]
MRLKEKIAIITGGGSGIGRATAIRFAKEGAKIVIADLNDKTGEEALGLIKELGAEAIFVKTNVADSKSIQNLINKTVNHFGGIDILFNNAGIGNSELRSVDLDEAEWNSVIDTNLKSVFLGIKYAIPELIKSGNGVIINTASLLGLKGKKFVSAYNASKGGVILLTQNAALEYGKYNIRVNAIAPGIIDTNIIERWKNDERKWPIMSRANALGRIGSPDEVASVALFLASEEASFVTGTTLSVDGGGLIF